MIADQAYAATEPHRRACEARELMRWPLAERRKYLADIRKTRGDAAADALQEELTTQWRIAHRNTEKISL